MKNTLPLVAAVILGLAAVFAVSKALTKSEIESKESMVAVVIATHDLLSMQELREGDLTYREVPESAAPNNALRWEDVTTAYGQRLPRAVGEDDYVLTTDVEMSASLADSVREGEWVIPVTFASSTLVAMMVPDDEIAILANWSDGKGEDDTGAATSQMTLLMPCVRVMGIVGPNGQFREARPGGADTILVSLPPHQAEILLAAQQRAQLIPVMRKRNDKTARNRKDGGVVDDTTFRKIRENLKAVELPEMPLK